MDIKKNKSANILTKIKVAYADFTASEKKIADYILTHPEEIYKLKISKLAESLGISLPTVFRFTKKIGFEGFSEFKVALIKDVAVGLNIDIQDADSDDIVKISKNTVDRICNGLNETINLIDFDKLSEAVKSIEKAKKIYYFAVSSSISVALDSYYKFIRAGYNCCFDSDIYAQRVFSTQVSPDDLAIGISFSGESKEVIDCLANAKKAKAKTICITSFINSGITKYSDIRLYTAPVQSSFQKVDLPSKISQTAILDLLYINVIMANREKVATYISRSEEELNKYRKN